MRGASCNDAGGACKAPVSSPGSDGQLRMVLQGWSESSQVRREAWRAVCGATEVSTIHTKHTLAVERLASQKENRFLGSPKIITEQAWMKWRQSCQRYNCDRVGLAELKQAVDRLRSAEAQRADPVEKKHRLPKTGEVKRCWRCGAHAERNSAPRVLLKTACSGAPRTKEYERALTVLGKGQHPKSSVFIRLPISDEEWDQWHESELSRL